MEEKKQNKIIFGIDLGTTYSCIAYIDDFGRPTVIRTSEGASSVPSVVQFGEKKPIVGDVAKSCAFVEPETVVEMVKRHMGEPNWHFSYEGKNYSAEQVSSYILQELAHYAEEKLEQPVKDVVITCPANFGSVQRKATQKAGELAGLNVREIINEPTSAALAYKMQDEKHQVVLVYDLGGGTLDVTINDIKNKSVRVVSIKGDEKLGGRDWDEAIVQYLVEQWQQKTGEMDDPQKDPDTLQDLWGRAERAKIALSTRTTTKVPVSYNEKKVMITLTREAFEKCTKHLLDRTITTTCEAIEAAKGKSVGKIDKILLVGGSTRMPQVTERLTQEFGIPLKVFDPDEAVAKGAAIYGQMLLIGEKIEEIKEKKPDVSQEEMMKHLVSGNGFNSGAVQPFVDTKIMNIASHSFGIIVTLDYGTPRSRETISNLILINDPLPKNFEDKYSTLYDNQQIVQLKIMETLKASKTVEAGEYSPNDQIGVVDLRLPPNLPKDTIIKVRFILDRQGLLNVIGREESTNSLVETSIKLKGVS